ncbi:MAG: 16S rRNA (cytosine(967)-C(5))-methyltransferase RsmB [Clostridia bacterium]|nr:16S rRNA (cytosine(967)-C(5))-methyltransferase RsmB [Clostridia bacterium]
MENVRAVALSVLNKCIHADGYSNIALDTAIKRGGFSDADRGLLTVLVYGTIEKQLTLDHWISHLSSRPLTEIDGDTLLLLRMGLYQLAYLDKVPDHAAVNETVALCPRRTRGFVNALLRAFLRQGKRVPAPDPVADPVGYLSVTYSFGRPLCQRFLEVFGMERTRSMLAAFCRPVPVTLRVNTLKTSRERLLEALRAAGAVAEPTPESPWGIFVKGLPVTALPGFDEGEFFVQDEASQLAVSALDAHPGMRVLDCCACPGSKSFGIAMEMEGKGSLLSCDLHANKLSLVRTGAERLGIGILDTLERDARAPSPAWEASFDRVLCDVPCSGFGVFAKKPEIKYKDPAMSAGLPAIQAAILKNACRFVKAGGKLVYSTCTLLPEENEGNVEAFLREHGEFSLLQMRTLYPDTDGTDGFFFAVLQKNSCGGPALGEE